MSRQEGALLISSLSEFFRDAVEDTLQDHGLKTSEETAFYLVNLLETFAKADALHGQLASQSRDEPLALMLKRALETTDDQSIPLYRAIGDRSLYISGFFGRSLRRRSVSPRYYYDLGRGAYEALSVKMEARRSAVFSELYAELAEKFVALVEVLIEISQRHTFEAKSGPSELIEHWAATSSPRAAYRLIKEGILPLWRVSSPGDGEDDPTRD